MTNGSAAGTPPTFGLALAGGLARRMGGVDKPLVRVAGRPILARVLAVLEAQCTGVIVSANGDPARLAAYGVEVIADDVPGFAGPLAGILAGLDYTAARAPGIRWVVSSPADCPFLPVDLVGRLHAACQRAGTALAYARSGNRRHPTVGLWPVSLRIELRHALVEDGERRVEAFAMRHGAAIAEWPDVPFDPFFNINTPEDAAAAERLAREHRA